MVGKGIGLLVILAATASIAPVFAADLERTSITDPRLENAFGAAVVDKINTNQQIQISADITNHQVLSQNFVYIIQIRDEAGLVVKVGWISGGLSPDQKFTASRSWTPIESGEYTAEIFVWEGLANHNALTNFVKLPISVS